MEDGALLSLAAAWRDVDPDPETRAELTGLIETRAMAELGRRFEGSLRFGTAGIRAQLGAGALRMNRLVVARFAYGLATYIAQGYDRETAGGVVVGYDGRKHSSQFAADVARVLARSGIAVWLLPHELPTPVLAFAVRYLGARWGVMITASHNPHTDNGIKLYQGDGAQLVAPADGEIAACMDAVDPLALPRGWDRGSYSKRDTSGIADAYVRAISGRSGPASERMVSGQPAIKVVHTALHGVGSEILKAVMTRAGLPAPVPVIAQERPDPTFPTAPFPNPEIPETLELAVETAEQVHGDLILANDPDADRLAVMVPDPQGWHALSGDDLGALIGNSVLQRLAAGRLLEGLSDLPPVVATSVVSSSLLRRMANAAGVRCVTTLTGFKWIARAGGAAFHLVYGYEEALGYALRPSLVADKDGISAALAVVKLAEEAAESGRTLRDLIDDISLDYGLYSTRRRAVLVQGADVMQGIQQVLGKVRRNVPRTLNGLAVTATDLMSRDAGVVDLAGGYAEKCPGEPVDPANVLIWHVGDGSRVMVRPSGTEPKLKIYAETVSSVTSRKELAGARAMASETLERLLDGVLRILGLQARVHDIRLVDSEKIK